MRRDQIINPHISVLLRPTKKKVYQVPRITSDSCIRGVIVFIITDIVFNIPVFPFSVLTMVLDFFFFSFRYHFFVLFYSVDNMTSFSSSDVWGSVEIIGSFDGNSYSTRTKCLSKVSIYLCFFL